MAERMDTITSHPSSQEITMSEQQNHQFDHPSNIMLRIILNRLKGQAEKTLAKEQAGFRTRSTMEQIFNIRVLIEKQTPCCEKTPR